MMEGRFDRLFSDLGAADFDDADLVKLAKVMTSTQERHPTPEGTTDSEENSGILAGYTYLGQFIDHDITFDPISELGQRITDLSAVVDFRTPRLDLDNLYGRGPGDNPFLYDKRGMKILLGEPLSGNRHDHRARDLQRNAAGRALIGDPRNDENRIVAQLQSTMIRFHNRMVDLLGDDASFADVRDQVRWHYQWLILGDFLPTIVNATTVRSVLPHLAEGDSAAVTRPVLQIERLRQPGGFFMPVEFSVAAYRFGHSMIRPEYRLNETVARRPIFSRESDPAADLGGMRPIPDDWAIDWGFFFDLGDGKVRGDPLDDPIARVPQHAYKIDSSVVSPLGHLPKVIAADPSSLALRNLERGRDFGLPSGESIAAAFGETPIEVVIGKATDEDPRQAISVISAAFAGRTPLWAYILSEAQVTSWAGTESPRDAVPIRLGPVGGRIVTETLAAMMIADPTSFLNAAPGFAPRADLCGADGSFGIAELIRATHGH